jgi:hypothetical protein
VVVGGTGSGGDEYAAQLGRTQGHHLAGPSTAAPRGLSVPERILHANQASLEAAAPDEVPVWRFTGLSIELVLECLPGSELVMVNSDDAAVMAAGGSTDALAALRNRWEQVSHRYSARCRLVADPRAVVHADTDPFTLSDEFLALNRARLASKKKFGAAAYQRLLDILLPVHELVTLAELASGTQSSAAARLFIRHDIDHDLQTAVEMAHWEADRGIRATYCVLHTAWYYGEFSAEKYRHTTQMIEGVQEIQALGHEINLHNNLPTVALLAGGDPVELLSQELAFLRAAGIRVEGTSTHGDGLCRKLDYRNFELFEECLRAGPRTVVYEGRELRLGAARLADHALSYEAYDFPKDLYITDSGGRPRVELDRPGRGGKPRSELGELSSEGWLTGLLTHPVWWDFTRRNGALGIEVPRIGPIAAVSGSGDLAV